MIDQEIDTRAGPFRVEGDLRDVAVRNDEIAGELRPLSLGHRSCIDEPGVRRDAVTDDLPREIDVRRRGARNRGPEAHLVGLPGEDEGRHGDGHGAIAGATG